MEFNIKEKEFLHIYQTISIQNNEIKGISCSSFFGDAYNADVRLESLISMREVEMKSKGLKIISAERGNGDATYHIEDKNGDPAVIVIQRIIEDLTPIFKLRRIGF